MSISVFDRGFAVTAIQAFLYFCRSPNSDQRTAISDVADLSARIRGSRLINADETRSVTAGRIAGHTGI
jgi:hypothetical protein